MSTEEVFSEFQGKEVTKPDVTKEKVKEEPTVVETKVEKEYEDVNTIEDSDDFFEVETEEKPKVETETPSVDENKESKPIEKEEQKKKDDSFFDEETPSKATANAEPLDKKTKPVSVEEKFDESDASESKKRTYMIYAPKGEGKTTLAFSFPGKIYCLSFDQKSIDVRKTMYDNDPRIKVKDAIRYLDKTSGEAWVESADKSFRYINHLLAKEVKEFDPDWIVIDGLEILVRDICEKTMRYRNSIAVFQPFNMILWQERNMYVDQIHMLCSRIAKKGVVYTAYVNTRSLKIEKGAVIETTREPKWAGDVKYKVDNVIRVKGEETEEGKKFFAVVESSKTKGLRTGKKAEITKVGIEALFDKEA